MNVNLGVLSRWTEENMMRNGATQSIQAAANVFGLRFALIAAAMILGLATPGRAIAAPPGEAAVTAIPTGCWQLIVTPDDAAIAEGRNPFEEYVMIETGNITAQEMSRLGFSPSTGTASKNALGQTTFNVTLKSGTQGTATWTGTFLSSTMVTGTLVWVKDGQTYNYTYTGTIYTPPVDVES
jgi:hypothetical protein